MMTEVKLDTYDLDGYALRLEQVTRRIARLDSRLRDLCLLSKSPDLWLLRRANTLMYYRKRLKQCGEYLRQTSKDFKAVEKISKKQSR